MRDPEATEPGLLVIKLSDSSEEIAGKIGRNLVRTFREPENLAALSGALVLPLVVFRGRRVPFIPFMIISLIGECGGRLAYRASRDLRTLAAAAEDGAMFPGKQDQ